MSSSIDLRPPADVPSPDGPEAGASLSRVLSQPWPAWMRTYVQHLIASRAATVSEQRLRMTRMVGTLTIGMAAVWLAVLLTLGLWHGATLFGVLLGGALGMMALTGPRPRAAAIGLAALLVGAPLLDAALGAGLRHPTLWIVALGAYAAGLTTRPWVLLSLSGGAVAIATALLLRDLGAAPDPSALWAAYALLGTGTVLSGVAGRLYARLAERSLDQGRLRADALGDRLSATEARHRSLTDRLPVGVFRSTPDGQLLEANPAFAGMLGLDTPEAARCQNLASFYAHPSQRQAFVEAMTRDGHVRDFLLEWRAPDGASRFAHVDARTVTGEDGATVYEGTARDVTDEHRARRALARVQARQTAVLRATTDAILVLDAAGTITFASPATETLLGRSPDAVRRTPFLGLVHPDARAAAHDALTVALNRPATAPPIETALAHADGHAVLVEGVWSAGRAADGGRVVSFRDITERRRTEVALRQARLQAEEGVRLKNALLANVSHEIRTPLTAILGFSEVLAAELGSSEHREFVDLIAESGERLMSTLSSVLDLAKLDAGRGALAPEPGRLAPTVIETTRLFRTATEAKGLELSVHVESPNAEAALDADAFGRVMRHLVGNAVKFTERGRVMVTVRAEGRRVVVEVADTGIGISPAFLPRLYEAFEQESAATGQDVGGVGVGLAISRRLVEQMGGEIAIASRQGEGTTVTLRFLRTDLAPDTRRADARPLALVLDDNTQARFVAERILSERYRVRSARTAADLLAAADELALAGTPAALALLDIHLGTGSTGDDVMRALRDRPAYAEAPLLAVTAYALPGDQARFLASGFDGYLTKPYTRSELFAAVDAALLARAPQPPPVPEPHGPSETAPPDAALAEAPAARPAPEVPVFVARPRPEPAPEPALRAVPLDQLVA